jgi:hypothetical protein
MSITGRIVDLKIDGVPFYFGENRINDKNRIKSQIGRCEISIKDLKERAKAVEVEKEILEAHLKKIEEMEEKPCDDIDGFRAEYRKNGSDGYCVLSYNNLMVINCAGPYRRTKQEAKEAWERMMKK